MTKDVDAREARAPFREGLGFDAATVEEHHRFEALSPGDKDRFLTELRRSVEDGLDEKAAWERAWERVTGRPPERE